MSELSRLWYNLTLPWRNWRMRRRLLAEWVAEGRAPERFPRGGRITRDHVAWANRIVKERGLP